MHLAFWLWSCFAIHDASSPLAFILLCGDSQYIWPSGCDPVLRFAMHLTRWLSSCFAAIHNTSGPLAVILFLRFAMHLALWL